MAKDITARRYYLGPRFFGLIIGFLIFLVLGLLLLGTNIFESLEIRLLDLHFNLRVLGRGVGLQEGVTLETRNAKISPDILLVGIDPPSLEAYGRWPFPRFRHADLVNSFYRIKDQNDRESSVFLDIFFNNIADRPFEDVMLIEAMEDNGRVFLETIMDKAPPSPSYAKEAYDRQRAMFKNMGEFTNISGSVEKAVEYYGVDPPMIPYGKAARGYGHANFFQDNDKKYRRVGLVVRYSEQIEEYALKDLTPDFALADLIKERLAWRDDKGITHTIPFPLTPEYLEELRTEMEARALPRVEDLDGDGIPETSHYVVRHYQDHFVPAITLALAINYFGRRPEDVEVVFGSHVRIPSPQQWDTDTGTWIPYEIMTKYPKVNDQGQIVKEGETRILKEIRIPVDKRGQMLINYMGGRSNPARGSYQTYPVRSYAGYAGRVPPAGEEQWPRTKALGGKILMVGAFSLGMADDEKPTPYGLMYGVEIHANALNTILMDNFLIEVPLGINLLILFLLTLGIAFLGSRVNAGWTFAIVFLILAGSFLGVTTIFQTSDILFDWAAPAIGMILAFLFTVVYRVLYEENEKKRITNNFGKFISPEVVKQITSSGVDPELGGIDLESTIFFSDIRSFSSISETMQPNELLIFLNEYLESMTGSVLQWKGTLDKYIGDAIMAIWGAPLPQENHAVWACKCALQQIEKLEELNQKWPENKRINIGIGLNSGVSTVGLMGSELRMDYSVIGDNVNLASRLEGANKQYKTQIIISESTREKIKDEPFVLRELDCIRVQGRKAPVTIYELVGYEGDVDFPQKG